MVTKLTLTRNSDNAVLKKANAINFAEIKIIIIDSYVPHYTPSHSEENKKMKQIVNRTPTVLEYLG